MSSPLSWVDHTGGSRRLASAELDRVRHWQKGRLAAVDRYHGSRDVAGLWFQEPRHGISDVLRLADSADRVEYGTYSTTPWEQTSASSRPCRASTSSNRRSTSDALE